LSTHEVPFVSVNACAALADVLQRVGCAAERPSMASAESSPAARSRAPTPVNTAN
jgi:hypothetical protein